MATITPTADSTTGESQPNLIADSLSYLRFLASLRLTVALFAAGIFIVLYGTLAQVEKDMWDVIADYFRAKWSWIEIRLLFPPSLFPPTNPIFNALQSLPKSVGFPFLGGWTIGFLLGLNLLAAHLFRFKLQAKGTRLALGLVVFVIGWVFIWMICGGAAQRSAGIQGLPILEWSTLWQVIKVLLAVTWVASIVKLLQMDRGLRVAWYGMLAVCVALGGLVLLCLIGGDTVRPADPSMRILWQLVQATIAGLILLVACVLLFKKRGGIVVIHLGVALVMFSELLVGLFAVEEQMQIAEGQTVSFARDLREIELAIVDSSAPDEDLVTIIPAGLLREDTVVEHPDLPFDVHILKRYNNANLAEAANAKSNLATAGVGRQLVAEPAQGASGTDTSGAVDVAAVYAKLVPKNNGDFPENTYLFSQQFGDGELLTSIREDRPEAIQVADKTYHVALRFKRTYKPYSMRLIDISKADYLGTSTPRDYSSYVHIVDPSNNFDRDDVRIWMNNPLRYGGETFYQSNYLPAQAGRPESTVLSVVINMGWMIPYVACMVVFVGLAAHFFATLTRFSFRLYRSKPAAESEATVTRKPKKPRRGSEERQTEDTRWGIATFAIPALMIGIVMVFALKPRESSNDGMDIDLFGKTPIVFEGRAKPIDTLARNALQRISNKQSLIDLDGNRQPATLWLLDVISQADDAEKHRVFRIENAEVRQRLGLERRKGYRYALAEFRDKVFDGYDINEDYDKDLSRIRAAAEKDAMRLTTYQRKLLEFDGRLSQYRRLVDSFIPLPFPPAPSAEEMKNDPDATQETFERIRQLMVAVPKMDEFLKQRKPPLVVPNLGSETTDNQWQCYAAAVNRAYIKQILSAAGMATGPIDEGVMTWIGIVEAYAKDNAIEFNRLVAKFHEQLAAAELANVDVNKVSFEASFNSLSPFGSAFVFYILALLVTAASWLFSSSATNRAAWWLIFATLLLHTFALGARIYISGRPPVTNLYSSAVFIGWGCVIFGLVFERIFPLGIGNLISAVCGFSTLRIATLLAATGDDTFTVLQAVLDTQFWLSTHVVCVTLGYSATFVAGLLGIVAVFTHLFGLSRRTVNPAAASFEAATHPAPSGQNTEILGTTITRMIYGTLCFGLFLSFVGTVLGGLWADDSWGRFWGWDPKENGALIIVLWNALILHARWGKMIGNRGLAVLAIIGNITTAWSWFGVNQLDVGLHSYGQFSGNAVFFLGLFVFGNLLIAAIGLTPRIWKDGSVQPQT